MDDETKSPIIPSKVRHVLGLLVLMLYGTAARADMPGQQLRDRDEAQVPMATKLLDGPLPHDLMAFNVVRMELEDLDFKKSAAWLRDYDQRRTLRRLIGEQTSRASTFREAIAEEAAAGSSIADYNHAVIKQGMSIDFEATASSWNFPHYPNVEYKQIEPGLWGMFRSSDAEKTADTALDYELPFTVTSRLTESVMLTFDLPKLGFEKNLLCVVDNVPRDVPVAARCDIQAPSDPNVRQKMLAALRQMRADHSPLAPVSGLVTPASPYGYQQQQEAMVSAYNLVHKASCKDTGRCVPGRATVSAPWLPSALLLAGLCYSAWRKLSGRSAGGAMQKIIRRTLAAYVVIVVAAIVLSVLDAGTKAPLSGVLGFLAAGVASLPWSVLALPAFDELADSSALKLMWSGVAINMIYLLIMVYGGPSSELVGRRANNRTRR